jgi:hypothetical protein
VKSLGGCRGEIVRSVEVEVVMLMLD